MDSCQGWIHVRDGFMSGMDSCQGWIHVSDGFMPERSCSCIPFSIPRRRRRPGAGDRVQAIGCRRSGAGDRVQANFAVGKGPIAAPFVHLCLWGNREKEQQLATLVGLQQLLPQLPHACRSLQLERLHPLLHPLLADFCVFV